MSSKLDDFNRFAKVSAHTGSLIGYVIGVVVTFIAMAVGWDWGGWILGLGFLALWMKVYTI